MEWIPWSMNEYADTISRLVELTMMIAVLSKCWMHAGILIPLTALHLASPQNKKLERFHSRFWPPGCQAVDTFTVDWCTSSVPYLPYHTSCL